MVLFALTGLFTVWKNEKVFFHHFFLVGWVRGWSGERKKRDGIRDSTLSEDQKLPKTINRLKKSDQFESSFSFKTHEIC